MMDPASNGASKELRKAAASSTAIMRCDTCTSTLTPFRLRFLLTVQGCCHRRISTQGTNQDHA